MSSEPEVVETEPEAIESAYAELEAAIDHTFRDRELLRMALTHRSYSNERGEDDNYERLEFLGDAVLGLVSSHWLYERFPDQPEGELAKLKGFVVSARVLSRHARAIGVGARLRLGVGEKRSGGRFKASILADAMESIFGAVYLDAGLEAARKVILPVLDLALAARARISHADAKTALQERIQGQSGGLPIYRMVKESGPDHRKLFTVECLLEGEVAGVAEGASKKQAEQRAAAVALEKLDLPAGEP